MGQQLAGVDAFTEIKRRLLFSDVYAYYTGSAIGNKLERCPFHNDKTGSLKPYLSTNSFYCFGCGIGGDVFIFVSILFGESRIEAAKRLNSDFGLGLFDGSFKPDNRLLEEREQAKARYGTILTIAGRVFDFLCHMYTVGTWVLDEKNGLQPKLLPDGTVKIYSIYAMYLQCHSIIKMHKEALCQHLNDYEHWRGNGDREQEQTAIDNIQLIVNGYAKGEDYAEWRKHND